VERLTPIIRYIYITQPIDKYHQSHHLKNPKNIIAAAEHYPYSIKATYMNAIRIYIFIYYSTAWPENRYPLSRDPGSDRGRVQLNIDGNADTYYTVALYSTNHYSGCRRRRKRSDLQCR